MMKKLMLFVLILSVAAFAQHGRSGGGGGRPAGTPVGGPSSEMGQAGGHGAEHASDMSTGHNNAGAKTPEMMLNNNPKLASKLDGLLPKGTTAQQACTGFKNLGQCVAAIHVSHNLSIPFEDLKTKMTGTGAVSLGKAIQELNPKVNAKDEAKKGKKQADADLQGSES